MTFTEWKESKSPPNIFNATFNKTTNKKTTAMKGAVLATTLVAIGDINTKIPINNPTMR